ISCIHYIISPPHPWNPRLHELKYTHVRFCTPFFYSVHFSLKKALFPALTAPLKAALRNAFSCVPILKNEAAQNAHPTLFCAFSRTLHFYPL
ncbi:MAG: hypothetical protein LUF25_03850, partial [Phascolarctobacterium sp.]|nr:hypothetical protein [Phascolarctobacterium sp.]